MVPLRLLVYLIKNTFSLPLIPSHDNLILVSTTLHAQGSVGFPEITKCLRRISPVSSVTGLLFTYYLDYWKFYASRCILNTPWGARFAYPIEENY